MMCTPGMSCQYQKTCRYHESTRVGEMHLLLELEGLVHLAGEPVDKEAAFAVSPSLARLGLESGIHCVLEQLDGDLQRHELSLVDVRSDEVAELRVWAALLSAQEVASGEVGKVILLNKKAALCSFS